MTKISIKSCSIQVEEELDLVLDKDALEKQMNEMIQKYSNLDCYMVREKYQGKVESPYSDVAYFYLNFYPKYPFDMCLELRIGAFIWEAPVALNPENNKLMEDYYESDSD